MSDSTSDKAIYYNNSYNGTVQNNTIYVEDDYGIWLGYSYYTNITDNKVTANGTGIMIYHGSNNTVHKNNVTANNGWGVYFTTSHNNTISENNITAIGENYEAVRTDWGSCDNIFSNNIIKDFDGSGFKLDVDGTGNILSDNIIIAEGTDSYGIEVVADKNKIYR